MRRCRKRVPCPFAVIELEEDEPVACKTFAISPEPRSCATRTRCSAHGGTRCRLWRIRGPVLGYSTDAETLSSIFIVRAAFGLPIDEVYARAVPLLTSKCYKTTRESYESVRIVAQHHRPALADDGRLGTDGCDRGSSGGAGDSGGGDAGDGDAGCGRSSGAGGSMCGGDITAAVSFSSSFRGFDAGLPLCDAHIKVILSRAKAAVRAARNRLHKGHVAIVEHRGALGDPVYKKAVKQASRYGSVGAIRDYRKKGGDALRQRWSQLLDGHAAGDIHRMRKWLEHGTRGPGGRSTRLRLARGMTQMRLLPTREQLRTERRVALDADGVPGHFLFTTSPLGRLERWDYVVGSSSVGLRRYQNKFKEVRRLKSHNNKFWDARHRSQTAGDESEQEDGGVYINNSDAETEGCYAPMETDPVRLEEMLLDADSFVEDMKGGNETKVVAVGYDAIAALQAALDQAVQVGTTVADLQGGPPMVISFAADGGTVRRKEITAFTASLSLPCLENGRTDLTPIIYCLSGEKRVGRDIASYINGVLVELLSHSFSVPVAPASDGSDSALERQRLVLHPTLQVCGTCFFSVVSCCAGRCSARI